ncbi:zinc finger MYND domain-containing protein 15 [Spea bombifrons]|uniref:zinc finger MYND domain-containing protein 15 n=1 Tax=Spea bombifrons TaxID=233779 RepID=UPI00234BCD6E|nr:zinc finger MYND domain-containing protein 15 [Spea bombifrons]
MEFVSGYRDAILDLSELLCSWYRAYLSDCSGRLDRDVRNREQEAALRGLPRAPVCWAVHVIPNSELSFQPRSPERQLSGSFYADDVLRFSNLSQYVRLVYHDCDSGDEAGFSRPSSDDLYRIDYVLVVVEESGVMLGVDFIMSRGRRKQDGPCLRAARAYHLLCQCMARPMGDGPPRRPKKVAVDDPAVHVFFRSLLPTLGVHVAKKPLKDWSLRENFTLSSKPVNSCHVCKKRRFEASLRPCGRCGAVLYCSEQCKASDWNKRPADVSHESWCQRMEGYMQFGEKLADLPFQFSQEVTSPTFDKERFLSDRHLTGGYWLAESIHYQASRLLLERPPWDINGGRESAEPLLKDTDKILRQTPTKGLKTPLVTWKGYYTWRGLSLNNPLAALLTYPLTIYHIITGMVPQHFPELNILKKQSLKIHIIDGRREYDSILLFWELAVLMPRVVIELVFVGETLPLEDDDRHFILQREGRKVVCTDLDFPTKNREGRSIQVKVHARPYHTLQAAKPDLVIGFNSGFWVNNSWLSTLPRLQSMKVPAYFSECSQYSCDVDAQVVSMATGGAASPAVLNPFRSPLRIPATDNCMPWYSNAFLFYLIYKSCNRQRNHAPPPRPAPAEPPFECSVRKKKKQPWPNNPRKRK